MTPRSQTAPPDFYFFPWLQNILMKFSYQDPDWPWGIHLKPDIPSINRTGPESGPFYVHVYCFICHHFFNLLMYIKLYIISLLSKFSPRPLNIPPQRENYPVPDPACFLDPGPDRPPELSKIPPCDPTFLGGLNGPVWGSPMVLGAPLVFSGELCLHWL